MDSKNIAVHNMQWSHICVVQRVFTGCVARREAEGTGCLLCVQNQDWTVLHKHLQGIFMFAFELIFNCSVFDSLLLSPNFSQFSHAVIGHHMESQPTA